MRNMQQQPSRPEQQLWRQLQPQAFRRQEAMGRYTMDFVCHPKKLVVEVARNQRPRYGSIASQAMRSLGYHVVRFDDADVQADLGGVVQTIKIELAKRPVPPTQPRQWH
jgi:very-short-patch-repair endonuclease